MTTHMLTNYERAKGSYGDAIQALNDGMRVARAGWNGKDMYLLLVEADKYTLDTANLPLKNTDPIDAPAQLSWIAMKTADNCLVPWLASQTDMLSKDWFIVN